MEFRREKQILYLNGERYAPKEILRLIAAERERQAVGNNGGSSLFPAETEDLWLFLSRWFDSSPFLEVHTSGSTGTPKTLTVSKERMMQSARLTCEFLQLQPGDTALLCMNLRYIGAMMVVVRALVAGLNLIVHPASGHPLAGHDSLTCSSPDLIAASSATSSTASSARTPIKFAAMVPLQVYNTLQVPQEKERLCRIDILIIGGGAIDPALEVALKDFPGAVYSTYGMTETLSHIALRRLNGEAASEHYVPFREVELSLSSESTLIIHAPLVCDTTLQTNDIARIYPDGSFVISGRKDNILNSGGIKVQAEEVEKALRPLIPVPFVITSVPDPRLGEAVTLLMEPYPELNLEELRNKMEELLPPYHSPKHIVVVASIPQTGNGKTDRAGCRQLAEKIMKS